MSEQALSFGRVFGIQLRLVLAQGWRGRAIGFGLVFVQLLAMVVFGVILQVSIDSDGVSLAQFVDFSSSFGVPLTRATAALLVSLLAMGIIAWFGPFKVWQNEAPSRREYHWAMPVDKGRHDLARVVAGLVVLLGWGVALYGTVGLLALASGEAGALGALGPRVWASLFLGPALLYLLTSFFTVRLEHPSGWLWAILGGHAAITTLSTLLPLRPVVAVIEQVLFRRFGLASAVGGPVADRILRLDAAAGGGWPAAWAIWALALSAAVVWAAHDRRRLP